MAKLIATIKAVITRLVFGTHGFIAIWQVTQFKRNSIYWYLSSPILLLFFEGIFTLTIKENQEWKWFCPSVFLYLSSVVPAIWLLELDKVERRLKVREETFHLNLTASAGTELRNLHNLIGVQIKLPEIQLSTETWVTLIEQFLMLILIIGRWMLPKGDLTRDQLSQLLLVYIGTAADIIEFFDSFKDDKIASEPILVLLTLGIWSWSLMQFTVVLTATKSRKSRLSSGPTTSIKSGTSCCCNIDVWGIALNIVLQDAPFLAFRLLIITHFKIISYMNVFFTCKNTLVILLQLYRLHVVFSENRKQSRKKVKKKNDFELNDISIVSDLYRQNTQGKGRRAKKYAIEDSSEKKAIKSFTEASDTEESSEDNEYETRKYNKLRKLQNTRKDTGYSTASSHNSRTKTSMSNNNKHKLKHSTSSQESSKEAKQKRAESSEYVKNKKKLAKMKKKLENDDDESVEASDSESKENEKVYEGKLRKKEHHQLKRAQIKGKSLKETTISEISDSHVTSSD